MGLFYPWHFYLRWPYYYLRPSTRNHSGLPSAPVSWTNERLVDAPMQKRLLFFGDLMCMKGNAVPEVDPSFIEVFKRADLVIGNCEAPVTAKHSSGSQLFVFQMCSDYVANFLHSLGAEPKKTILSIANNHIGDQSMRGCRKTVEYLSEHGIEVIGQRGPGQSPLRVLTTDSGQRIGLTAWTKWLNWESFAADQGVQREPDILGLPWQTLKKELRLDFLVGYPHWEYEFQHYPCKRTVAQAGDLMSDGFDLLVGNHPHVLQPVHQAGERRCFFSLGNLIGPSFPIVSWPVRLGAFLEVTLAWSPTEPMGMSAYTMHPFYQLPGQKGEATQLRPLEALPETLRRKVSARFAMLFHSQVSQQRPNKIITKLSA